MTSDAARAVDSNSIPPLTTPPQGLVMALNVNDGMVSSDFMCSVIAAQNYDREHRHVLRGYLPWKSSGCLDLFRNIVIENALMDADFEWFWFLDSDTHIETDTLYLLLDAASADEFPVVSGLYPQLSEQGNTWPCAYHLDLDPTIDKVTMIHYESVSAIPDDGIVDGVGAGCLLMHRSLLEAMRLVYHPMKPWFDMEIFNDVPYSEDLTFSMRVAQMGFKIKVVHEALVKHNKTVKLQLPGRTANARVE